jgi:hypothetical protein
LAHSSCSEGIRSPSFFNSRRIASAICKYRGIPGRKFTCAVVGLLLSGCLDI